MLAPQSRDMVTWFHPPGSNHHWVSIQRRRHVTHSTLARDNALPAPPFLTTPIENHCTVVLQLTRHFLCRGRILVIMHRKTPDQARSLRGLYPCSVVIWRQTCAVWRTVGEIGSMCYKAGGSVADAGIMCSELWPKTWDYGHEMGEFATPFPTNYGQSAWNSVKVQSISTLQLANHARTAAEMLNRRNCLHYLRTACSAA